MSNPLFGMLGNSPMSMMMQIMSSGNPQQMAMQLLAQKNPQAYQMIQQGANPEQLMQRYGITQEQIKQVQSQFGNNLKR